MRVKSLVVAAAVCAGVLLTGCREEPRYRIGVSQCSQDDWRLKMNEELLREALLHDDVEVEIVSADDDSAKQKADLQRFAHEGVDIIIVAPTEAEALTPTIDSIYHAGIPVIVFDRHTFSDNYTSFQGGDNRLVGLSAARYANMLSTSPKVIEIEGKPETTPARERHEGFAEGIAGSGGEVLASAVGEWTREEGRRVADSLLRVYPDADIIYAHNDRMAIGASEAAQALGRRGGVKIIGIDASPEIGIRAVLDTVIDATFIYPTEGRKLMQTAMAVLRGEKVEKNNILPTRTAVDLSNAEMMLIQNEALKAETDNIRELKEQLDIFGDRYSAQSLVLYSAIAVLGLLGITIFLLMRSFWVQRRHRALAEAQNEQLQKKNDEINQILAQLRQATQSKLTFFTNVSHDLRTPLTLIAEPVANLEEADNLTPRQHKLVQLASKNVKVLMRLINQILDFRKYENGRLDLHLTEINLGAALRDWTEAFREMALRHRLKFKVDIPDDGDFDTAVDVDKMERVLFNLLSNAFKFTGPSGTVRVSINADADHIWLSVRDNGKGINKDDIGQVFERFFKSKKANPEGSGIGLALSKAFVELHGGEIEVESEEGRGTVFTVRIPRLHADNAEQTGGHAESTNDDAVKAELAPVLPEEATPSESASTLLVIDDNPDIRALVATLMSDRYVVLQASGGAEGIKLATKHVPDIIICDVMMPGIDGLETCRRLKEEVTTSHIPILMLTACAMEEQKIAGYECGADDYLTKPFSSRMLDTRITSLVANRRRLKDLYNPPQGKPSPAPAEPSSAPKWTRLEDDFYDRFMRFVNEHIADPSLSVDMIASAMGINRVQLYRKIKSLTSYSPTDLLRNIRLEQASRMLKTTEATVSEICFAVGFASHSYFTKCYREYFGESPSDAQRRTSKPRG